MPTPVGPAPRDPNDPDLWDWSGGEDEYEPMARRHPALAVIAAVVVAAVVLTLVAGGLF